MVLSGEDTCVGSSPREVAFGSGDRQSKLRVGGEYSSMPPPIHPNRRCGAATCSALLAGAALAMLQLHVLDHPRSRSSSRVDRASANPLAWAAPTEQSVTELLEVTDGAAAAENATGHQDTSFAEHWSADGKVSFGLHGFFLTAEKSGSITANSLSIGAWQVFDVVTNDDREKKVLEVEFTANDKNAMLEKFQDLISQDGFESPSVTLVDSEGNICHENQDPDQVRYPVRVKAKVKAKNITDGTFSLKTNFGRYVSIRRDGIATTRSEVGRRERFRRIKNKDGTVSFQGFDGTLLAGPGRHALTLLTSAFVPRGRGGANDHVQEILAAIEMNCANRFITEVHILTESNCEKLQQMFFDSRLPATAGRRLVEDKIRCVHLEGQPTYADFFKYANAHLGGHTVVLSNGDIVFDDSVALIERGRLAAGGLAYVLSATPPPHSSNYSAVFGQECDNSPRCVLGRWGGGGAWGQRAAGSSWDVYVFDAPLPGSLDLGHIDLFMNVNGAENLAAYQLEAKGGLKLYNPCEHIHAYHWHCIGGKMHSTDLRSRADRPPWFRRMFKVSNHTQPDGVDGILPCWDCPGVQMPKGASSRSELCRDGHLQVATNLQNFFRQPQVSVSVCCPLENNCMDMDPGALPQCRKPADMKCLVWESTWLHRYY
jgi:hypothetical protein